MIGDGRDGRRHVRGEHLLRRAAAERRAARQQFVRHHAERIDVRPRVGIRVSRRLLRAHVRRRAERNAHCGELLAPRGFAQRFGHAEIRHERVTIREHHVLGLQVAMHHRALVRVRHRVGDVAEDAHRIRNRQFAGLEESLPKRGAVHVRHHIEQVPVGFAGIVQREDVRMREARRDADLAEEALLAERCREVVAQNFERHLTVVLQIHREVHGRHAAGAELALDAVPAREGHVQAVGLLGHGNGTRQMVLICVSVSSAPWRRRRSCARASVSGRSPNCSLMPARARTMAASYMDAVRRTRCAGVISRYRSTTTRATVSDVSVTLP